MLRKLIVVAATAALAKKAYDVYQVNKRTEKPAMSEGDSSQPDGMTRHSIKTGPLAQANQSQDRSNSPE